MGERDLALGGGTVGFVTVCFKDGGELSSLSESDSDEVDSSELLSTCGCACTGGCFVTRTVAWPADESESESDDEDDDEEDATRLLRFLLRFLAAVGGLLAGAMAEEVVVAGKEYSEFRELSLR